MGRLYGTFQYGEYFKYGAPSVSDPDSDIPHWIFQVAWDGTYTGDNEALRMSSFHSRRGRRKMLDPRGGFAHFDIGEAVGIFDNEDGRYDPYNTTSPLYPNVSPGKFVRIYVDTGYFSGFRRSVMWGKISEIEPIRYRGRDSVRIKVVDGLSFLREAVVRLGLQQTVDLSALGGSTVPVNVDWPTAEWSYQGTSGTLNSSIAYFWGWQKNAVELIREIEAAELGVFLHSRAGQRRWLGGKFTYDQTITITEDEVLRDIIIPQPWETVRNKVIVYSYPKQLAEVNTTLWELQETPAIGTGEYLDLDILFRYDALSVCGSSVTFNYDINSQADGGGIDLADDFSYNAQIGNGAEISYGNISGSGGYVILLRAVGDAIYASDREASIYEDSTSQSTYGVRPFVIDTPWIETAADAEAIAAWALANLKDPQLHPIIQFEGRPETQFPADLYIDRIRLQLPSKNIDAYFRIGGIEHEWVSDNGVGTKTTWYLEPYFTPIT